MNYPFNSKVLLSLLWITSASYALEQDLRFKKEAGETEASFSYSDPKMLSVTNQQLLKFRFVYPQELAAKELTLVAKFSIVHKDSAFRYGLVLHHNSENLEIDHWEIPKEFYSNVYLKFKTSPKTPVHRDPNPFDAEKIVKTIKELKKSVAYMEKRSGNGYVNLCTAMVIGKSLLMTNNHCVSTQLECEQAEFTFSNQDELTFWGEAKKRKYRCMRLLQTNAQLDFSLIRLFEDPTPYYPAVPVVRSRHLLSYGTSVFFIRNRPDVGNAFVSCRSQESWRVLKAGREKDIVTKTISNEMSCSSQVEGGFSGSPVLNSHGRLIGLLWGSEATKTEVNRGYYTPAWTFLEPIHESLLKSFGLFLKPFED